MSGASDIADALRQASVLEYPPLREAVAATAGRLQALTTATDLMDVIKAADSLSLCAEGIAKAAEALHEAIDAALLVALDEAGAPSIGLVGHTLSTRRNAPGVDVPDISAVPPTYLIPREPKVDLPAVRKLLQREQVNWASLREPTISLVRRTTA